MFWDKMHFAELQGSANAVPTAYHAAHVAQSVQSPTLGACVVRLRSGEVPEMLGSCSLPAVVPGMCEVHAIARLRRHFGTTLEEDARAAPLPEAFLPRALRTVAQEQRALREALGTPAAQEALPARVRAYILQDSFRVKLQFAEDLWRRLWRLPALGETGYRVQQKQRERQQLAESRKLALCTEHATLRVDGGRKRPLGQSEAGIQGPLKRLRSGSNSSSGSGSSQKSGSVTPDAQRGALLVAKALARARSNPTPTLLELQALVRSLTASMTIVHGRLDSAALYSELVKRSDFRTLLSQAQAEGASESLDVHGSNSHAGALSPTSPRGSGLATETGSPRVAETVAVAKQERISDGGVRAALLEEISRFQTLQQRVGNVLSQEGTLASPVLVDAALVALSNVERPLEPQLATMLLEKLRNDNMKLAAAAESSTGGLASLSSSSSSSPPPRLPDRRAHAVL